MSPSPPRLLGRGRLLAFSVLVTLGFFVGVNALVERAERAGLVETTAAIPPVQLVAEPLFEEVEGAWQTTAYAEQSLVRSRFPSPKGDAWRLFVLGGSWAMGSPYQGQGMSRHVWPGGLPGFLRGSLDATALRPTEVINAAAGGQDSHRVARIAATVLDLEPDALLVATCNNDGAPPPSAVADFLAQQGAARLLSRLRPAARPGWHTAQDPDSLLLRNAFEANLETIAAATAEGGVHLYLATLPTHLDYVGFEPGHLPADYGPPDVDFAPLRAGLAADPLPVVDPLSFRGVEPCPHAKRLADANDPEAALPLLQRCIQDPSGEPIMARAAAPALAWAWLRRGERIEEARAELARHIGPCNADGVVELHTGAPQAALDRLLGCREDPAESLRWIGFAQQALGRPDEARAAWRQSVEYSPRTRCRPSFNAAVRKVAARHEHATLLDLEEAFEALPAPPPERPWFLDCCHMDWTGYAALGRAAFAALREGEPGLLPVDAEPLDDEAFRVLYDLPDGSAREQLGRLARAAR